MTAAPSFGKTASVPEPMVNSVEFFRWWVVDSHTGERRLTTYKLSRADAERAFPGASPDPSTRELRTLPDPGAWLASKRAEDR